MIFIGVDPGKSGAIAFLKEDGEACAVKNDCTYLDLSRSFCEHIKNKKSGYKDTFAVIEEVHSSPQMGVKSAFSFGQSFGSLLMLLSALQVPHERVRPQKWQRELGCLTKGDKNVSKRRAQELYPSLKVTHAIADALLLAEYSRRLWTKGDSKS